MIIKKLKVNNIRSYISQEINLPEGSVLLAGDIGTGKSSLLLAIEFALFGLQKGELTGSSLLRNGEHNGSVELHLNINNKEIIIHRELKRSKTGITQDNCYIVTDNEKKLLTPQETRQKILNLLNYPKETLTKKPVIYRYTVYTPQEQMKQILFDDDETRINSIRKVFNMDKYGRIKSNSRIIIDRLKENISRMEGIIINLDEIKERKNQKEIHKDELNKKINEIKSPLEEAKKKIANLKKKIENAEKDIASLNILKRDYEVLEIGLKNIIEKREQNIAKLKEIKERIRPMPEFNMKEKDEKDLSLNKKEFELKEIARSLNELNTHIRKSQETINKIINIDKCPTCEQVISAGHKEKITVREYDNINRIKKEFDRYTKMEKEYEGSLIMLKKEIEDLRKKENEVLIMKSEQIINKNLLDALTEEQKLLESNLNELAKRKKSVHEEINTFAGIGEEHKNQKEILDNLQQKERELEIKNASFNSELAALERELETLKEEIRNKQETKQKIKYIVKLRTWLTDNFTSMIEAIEKNVMLKLNYDFNTIFQKWFNNIMEDENMTIKINESFSPLITQNNHDINYEYLSGGEKTAIALSYRLALNQVINSVMSNLNTKDIIILDEPTDGFSTEQLDRVRTVLNELNARQVILVSHESKIESFVDNVIRFNKKGHISSILL